ncbi:unnamed protein product [Protopolystoma xenopodis]|uniref:Uncharacterized protein n=1 Tax=Protopolystoma xenopodis TaxID=117903 RepID=A0A448WU05_9PLAT|nr:unnamed protein product [Protopolystoma xenopodis]
MPDICKRLEAALLEVSRQRKMLEHDEERAKSTLSELNYLRNQIINLTRRLRQTECELAQSRARLQHRLIPGSVSSGQASIKSNCQPPEQLEHSLSSSSQAAM